MKQQFSRFAHTISFRLASAWSYVVGFVLILAWIVTGPYFNYSPQWQFVMTAGTSIATFLLVLILQHTDFRQTKAIQLKLDEFITCDGSKDRPICAVKISSHSFEASSSQAGLNMG
ncbi:MAG: low affinity iron permease family protein, partial [Deltaproteobacteria bacterium]|nr:low affinity iron permease family protein [Deltaproteobacteria bacterium]